MAVYNAWGWVGSAASTGVSNSGDSDVEGGLSNSSYDTDGTELSFANYGQVQFETGSSGTRVSDTDSDDRSSNVGTDAMSVDGGATWEKANEISVYTNTTIDYVDGNGNPQTLTGIAMRVVQLDDGTVIMRMLDTALQSAYNSTGFHPGMATAINLGNYNGTDYTSIRATSHDLDPPCFTPGTLISTDRGPVAVEDIKVGDTVLTADYGSKPVIWIGRRKLHPVDLILRANLRPIRIRRGCLGAGLPTQDLVVSPQHRMLVKSVIAERMFGQAEVLVAAKHLTEVDGVDIAEDIIDVEYLHFMCEGHQVVTANGAKTESLYLGPMAALSMGEAAIDEIYTLFPELCGATMQGARPLIPGGQGRKLGHRHAKNKRQLVMS